MCAIKALSAEDVEVTRRKRFEMLCIFEMQGHFEGFKDVFVEGGLMKV